MEVKTLFQDNPSFHVWGDGSPANFGVSNAVIQAIHSKVKPKSVTLETGSGLL
jgi:hypothetical protein